MVASLDQLLASLGQLGRFQIVATFCLWSNTFPLALNNFVMVFYGLPPEHHCKLPENSTFSLNESIPFSTKNPSKLDTCSMYSDPSNASLGTVPCTDGWEYGGIQETKSIVAQFELVCDRERLVRLATSIYFVGVMLGGILGGLLGDRFGRQPVILVTIYLQAALGFSVVFLTDIYAFLVVRCLQAVALQAMQVCSFTLMMEFFSPRLRTIMGTVNSLAWTSSSIVLALVCYLLDNWWQVQLALTLPSILSFLYFWFIPESMRWLVSLRKLDQAEKLATKIAKFNRVSIAKAELRSQLEHSAKELSADASARYGLLDLVRTPKVRVITLVSCFIWFTASVVVYGISFSLGLLGGSIYASFGISGAVEIVVRLLMMWVLSKFGRKWPTVVSLVLSAIACGAVPIIQNFATGKTGEYAAMAAAVAGKAFMTACFTVISIYVTELFPTVVRSVGQGACIFCTRIGGIIAPQLPALRELWSPAPFVLCSALALVGALLTLLLEDTQGKSLPDMIDDIEHPGGRTASTQNGSKHSVKKDVEMVEGVANNAFEKDDEKDKKTTTTNGDAKSSHLNANGNQEQNPDTTSSVSRL